MAHPLVSVIVPSFNRLEWLPAAVLSVQAQTLPDWELVLIDDGSTDGTARWARSLAEPRLRYFYQNHTGSIAAARNAGVREARGEWIAFLDSDDRWRPDKLARQLARLREVADARWCYSGYQMVNRQGDAVPQPSGALWHAHDGWFVDRILTTQAAVLIPTVLVPAELASTLRFDERMPLAEDYDFVLRLAAIAQGCVVDDVLAEIRIHEARTTALSGRFDGYFGKVIAYRKAAHALPDRRLRQIARRQLRAHLGTFLRRALRHGAVGDMVRVAGVFARR
jgi:glycosyltransferase involved in cell wall biosynthesis